MGRYEVGLPWIGDVPELRPNYSIALGRMRSTLKKLREQPELLKSYNDVMQSQIESGILEPVDGTAYTPFRIHYLPHQPVVKVSSTTTKLRIVIDPSAKQSKHDVSLNDCLFRGNVYAGQGTKEISAIIARVRLATGLLTLDLEKAFLQMELRESDRDVTRLFWPRDPFTSDTPQVWRFTKVPFGLKSAPFLLGAVIQRHLNKYDTTLARNLDANSYVDNFMCPWTCRVSCFQLTSNHVKFSTKPVSTPVNTHPTFGMRWRKFQKNTANLEWNIVYSDFGGMQSLMFSNLTYHRYRRRSRNELFFLPLLPFSILTGSSLRSSYPQRSSKQSYGSTN